MRRSVGLTASLVLALAVVGTPSLRAQERPAEHPTMGHTLFYGSGYITTPYAMVPRTSLFGTFSAAPVEGQSGNNYTLLSGAGGITLGRFIEVGGTMYEPDEIAAHGKIQVIKQRGIFPSIGGGVLNLTTSDRGRFGIEDDRYADVEDATTFYGVMTYVIGPGRASPFSWISASVGWGSGLFSEDNDAFAHDGTGGVFGAVSFDFQLNRASALTNQAFLRIMVEYDGFDANVGLMAYLSGLEFHLGVLSADEGGVPDTVSGDPTASGPGTLYNQAKFYASISMDVRVLPVLPWIFTGEGED